MNDWNQWLASKEGQRCADYRTLEGLDGAAKYLENRLWRAFMAGARAESSPLPASKEVQK